MKGKILVVLSVFLFFHSSMTFSQDTNCIKYMPLSVGNVYRYDYSSPGASYSYKIRIVKDTIIGSKKYFILNGTFPGMTRNVIRIDSIMGNIYGRSSMGYCPYSPFEILFDSMRAQLGDSTIVCYSQYNHCCTDTNNYNIFGMTIKSKTFSRLDYETLVSVKYGFNFGIVAAYYSGSGFAIETLKGCYVNGVLYGDTTVSIIPISGVIPEKYSLHQNYPNPFNPVTNIKFDLPKSSLVKLVVYDATGREVTELVNESLNAGCYQVDWDGSDYPSGVYFYKLQTENFSDTKRMVMIK